MELVHRILDLINIESTPVIAVESPLQERRRFLINIVAEVK